MGSSRSAVAIRHVAFEDLGLLAPILKQAGFQVTYREAGIDDLVHPSVQAAELLVVLGGPIGVYEDEAYPFLADEIRLLERRLRDGKPVLGICLGCQLMARALGARVFAGAVKEIGWGRVEVTPQGRGSCLAALAGPDSPVLHWHGDTFDLPQGAVRLASNERYDNQAFSFGGSALGLQFHLEADPDRLESWYVGHAAELAAARISVPALRAQGRDLAPALAGQARAVFEPWLESVGFAVQPNVKA